MDRTVKEIAKSLGTNKNVVYRIIDKYHLEPVPSSEDGANQAKRYSDDDYFTIKTEFQKLQTKHQENARNDSQDDGLSPTIELLLRAKDDEIDRLRAENDRLHAQVEKLTTALQQEQHNMSEFVKHEQTLRAMTLSIEANHKPGFFERLRGKFGGSKSEPGTPIQTVEVNQEEP